jgi:predicted Fe-S protein YdhL (DUF1289 family)
MIERSMLVLPELLALGATVPSPCNSVCRIDPATRLCEGCMRNLDEIADWSVFDADEKRAVWAQLPDRFDRVQASAKLAHKVWP